MTKVKCDLHIHSTCSDGKIDPFDLLKEGERQNLDYISITDHDTIDAYKVLNDIEKVKSVFSGKLIYGVEANVLLNNKTLHLLGYGWDYEKFSKYNFLDPEVYHSRMQKGLDMLIEAGKKVGLKMSDDLKIPYPTKAHHKTFYADISKYEENQEIMKNYSMKNTFDFAKDEIVNPNSIFYIPFSVYVPDFYEVANAIHECGGKVVLAHAFGYVYDGYEVLNDAFNTGLLDGVECHYFFHTKEETDYLVDFCNKNNLIITGGTDCHGKEMFYKDETFEVQLGHVYVLNEDIILNEDDIKKL